MNSSMKLRVELERETDGRWIGEVPSLPGVLAYDKTRKQALAAVEALAQSDCGPCSRESRNTPESNPLIFS